MHIISPMTSKLTNWMSMSAKSFVRIENKLHPFGRLIKGGEGRWGDHIVVSNWFTLIRSKTWIALSSFGLLKLFCLYIVHYHSAVASNIENFLWKGGCYCCWKIGFHRPIFALTVLFCLSKDDNHQSPLVAVVALVVVGCSGCVSRDLKVQVLQAPSIPPSVIVLFCHSPSRPPLHHYFR